MAEIALRLNVEVQRLNSLDIRGAASPEERLIFYSPSGYLPRDEFTIAHELMELHLPRSVLDLHPRAKERFCDRGAAALLMPRQQFLFTLHGTGFNLPELRRRFPWASYGAVAARFVDLVPGTAAAAFVNEKREWMRVGERLHQHIGDVVGAKIRLLEESTTKGFARIRKGAVAGRAWRLTERNGRKVTLTVVREI